MKARDLLSVILAASLVAIGVGCNKEEEHGIDEPPPTSTPDDSDQPKTKVPVDGDIRLALLRELAVDGVVPPESIGVKVTDGIVELTGTVPHILAKERAVRIAEGVKGVRAVSDRLAVKPQERPDKAVAEDVKKALLMDPATDSYEVDVKVENQVVTLTGKVDSWAERELAATVAAGVKGVAKVDNQLKVVYEKQRPDSEIASEIERRLRWDTLVDDALIDVSVADGHVVLTGTVGSVSEQRRAAYDAWVSGVEGVKTEGLVVARWARDDDLRKHKYDPKSDQEISEAIRLAAALDPRVKSFNLETQVDSGVVTLKGMVDNLRARNAAQQLAQDTVGVASVHNELKVEPKTPVGKRKLEAEIKDALFRNPITEGYEIHAGLENGVVTLTGKVDSYAEKAEADEVVSGIVGAIRVVNELEVEHTEHPYTYDPYLSPISPYTPSYTDYTHRRPEQSDAKIAAAIEKELEWSPFVNADEIQVRVEDGKVTLTGRVDSWREHEVAIENAFEGGALTVDAANLHVGL